MILPNPSILLASRAITGNVTSAAVAIPYGQPKYAEQLDPQLPALSIEMDRWADWAGPKVGQPNEFVNNIFAQVSERNGKPMYLRVGGKS
jgi:hypothetical protein